MKPMQNIGLSTPGIYWESFSMKVTSLSLVGVVAEIFMKGPFTKLFQPVIIAHVPDKKESVCHSSWQQRKAGRGSKSNACTGRKAMEKSIPGQTFDYRFQMKQSPACKSRKAIFLAG